jgi:hypothetical protein
MKRVLLNPTKEIKEPTQRKTIFRIVCKEKVKCCKVIIDSGSTENLVSIEMVEKLGLKKVIHPTPYKVSWIQKGHHLLVNEQCEVEFQIGSYKDKLLCDIMPMDVCHIFLDRPWQYEKKSMHDRRINLYTLEKDGEKHTLFPLKEESAEVHNTMFILSKKEFFKDETKYKVIDKPKAVVEVIHLLPED